jgi:hypothetical protein
MNCSRFPAKMTRSVATALKSRLMSMVALLSDSRPMKLICPSRAMD